MTTKEDGKPEVAAPEKITQEEMAHLLYKNEVVHDAWKTEQESLKSSYYGAAKRFITLFQNAGYDIVKRTKKH